MIADGGLAARPQVLRGDAERYARRGHGDGGHELEATRAVEMRPDGPDAVVSIVVGVDMRVLYGVRYGDVHVETEILISQSVIAGSVPGWYSSK